MPSGKLLRVKVKSYDVLNIAIMNAPFSCKRTKEYRSTRRVLRIDIGTVREGCLHSLHVTRLRRLQQRVVYVHPGWFRYAHVVSHCAHCKLRGQDVSTKTNVGHETKVVG